MLGICSRAALSEREASPGAAQASKVVGRREPCEDGAEGVAVLRFQTKRPFFLGCALLSILCAACSDDDGGAGAGTGGATSANSATQGAGAGTSSSDAGSGGDDSVGSGGADTSVGPVGTGGDVGSGGDAGTGGGPGAGGGEPGALAIGLTAIRQVTIGELGEGGTASTNGASSQSGSLLLVSLARGDWDGAPDAPTDSFGNVFGASGSSHNYEAWPSSATGLYSSIGATGGEGHVLSMTLAPSDEVSLSAVEVRGATSILDASWIEEGAASSITSGTVHVDGAAMLVAWWWGSGGVRPVGNSHVAVPGDGFTVLPEATGLVSLSENGYIQVAVAYRAVDAAGDYSVSWTTDEEGAQLYLVAVR